MISEKDIRSLWNYTLRKTDEQINENFFELGGDSLNALNMLFALSKRFGIEVSPSAIFEYPTFEAFCSFVLGVAADQARGEDQTPPSPSTPGEISSL